jgi:hypothetical protein
MVAFALSILGLCVLSFHLGATLTWAWAKGSLDVPPPPWVPAIGLVAGCLFVASALLGGSWPTALSMAALFSLMSGHQGSSWWRAQRSRSRETA